MHTIQVGGTSSEAHREGRLQLAVSMFARHSGTIAVAAVVLTAIVGALLAIHLGNTLRYQDETQYVEMATRLLTEHLFGVHPGYSSALRPPGFVWFLVPLLWLHASVVALRLYNLCLLLAAQGCLFFLLRRTCSSAAGALAVVLTLTYPVLLYTSVLLFPQTLGALLFLALLWLLLGVRAWTLSRALVAGFIAGLLILTIPTFLPIVACLLLYLVLDQLLPIKSVGVLVLICAITVGGWTARNYVAFNRFVLVATNGGVNLLLGNSDQATPTSGSLIDISQYVAEARRRSEVDDDHYYARSAELWIKDHPQRAATLYIGKLVHYFGFSDQTSADDPATSRTDEVAHLLMAVTYGFFLLVYLTRLLFVKHMPLTTADLCFAGVYLINALLASLFFTRIRLRLPFDWLLLALVAGTLWRTGKTLAGERTSLSAL